MTDAQELRMELRMEHGDPPRFFCYIVANDRDRTYNGYTTNLRRRLRQHNGELVGGARATRGRGPWHFVAVLTSLDWTCGATAMRHEWSIKYPTRKRPRPKAFDGALGRVMSLRHVFEHMVRIECSDRLVLYASADAMVAALDVAEPFDFVEVAPLHEIIM